MLAGSGLIIFIYIKESRSEAWALVGVVVVFLSMFPYLNNKIFKMEKPTAPNHRQDTQSGSINHDGSDSSEPLMQGSSSTISYHTFHSSSSSNMTGIKNVTPDGNYTPPDNTSAWKVVLISAFFQNRYDYKRDFYTVCDEKDEFSRCMGPRMELEYL